MAWALAGGPALAMPPLKVADRVDLARYMGTWRVVACMMDGKGQYFVDATETYRAQDLWRIQVTLRWREKSLSGAPEVEESEVRVMDPGENARWQRKPWMPWGDSMVILAVDKDYQWAVVGEPSRKEGWVLSRSGHLPAEAKTKVIEVLQANGYDAKKFRSVPQAK